MRKSALAHALEVGQKAAEVGFDWEKPEHALDKVREEVDELAECIGQPEEFEELGDLFFALVNVARKLKIDPEVALDAATTKFQRRFEVVVECAKDAGKEPNDFSLDVLEGFWQEAKARELDYP